MIESHPRVCDTYHTLSRQNSQGVPTFVTYVTVR